MKDQPLYNEQFQQGLDRQVNAIENSVMPLIQAITLQLENAWYVPGTHTEFYYNEPYQEEVVLKSLDELKSLLISGATWQFEKKQEYVENGSFDIALVLDEHAKRVELRVSIDIRLYQGHALFFNIGNQQTGGLHIETKDISAISFLDLPRVFSRVMLDMWCEALQNLPEAFPFIIRQRFWFDDECYTAGHYHYPREVWNRVVKNIRQEAVQKVVKELRSLNFALLSGDDSGLKNTWEEICVQVQDESSFDWEAYETTIENYCDKVIDELPEYQQVLLTHECETTSGENISPPGCKNIDLITFWLKEQVIEEANSFTNRNIERYLSGEDDEQDEEEYETNDDE